MKALLERYSTMLRGVFSPVNIYTRSEQDICLLTSRGHSPALDHVAWMLENMPSYETDHLKWQRWLGFIQGVLWAKRIYNLNELRKHTREAGAV